MIESQVMSELDISEQQFSRLPRHVKQACWEGGVPAMIKAGYKFNSSNQQQQHGEDSSSSSQQQQQQSLQMASRSTISQQQQYGPYFKRQYLFVAATMPVMTKGDVGTELQKRFKNAVWVSGDMLHQVKPHVDHNWVKLHNDNDVYESLVSAIRNDPVYQAGRARVLVFTRNTKSADQVRKEICFDSNTCCFVQLDTAGRCKQSLVTVAVCDCTTSPANMHAQEHMHCGALHQCHPWWNNRNIGCY